MATRLYLQAQAGATPISPTPDAAWEDTTILVRTVMATTPGAAPMTTVSFTDNNAALRDILFRQCVSATALSSGQTVTGGQSLKAQARVSQVALTNNLFLTLGIRIIASDGSTVQKTVLGVTQDDSEAGTTLVNRQFTASSAATNYTTVAGDYVVIEVGTGGNPDTGSDHDSSLRLGDAATSDLPEDNTDTTDLRPWVELTDTLTFLDLPRPQAIF